jgi:ParB family transcriptional regulator, chromosome partitioning protein
MAKPKRSKKAFDFARDTMWKADPLDLCIIGGKKLPANERGPLDTDDDESHALWDPRVLDALDPDFVANITAYGVDTPILICKVDGVAVVIAGKSRVRAARLANKKRKSAGELPIKIDCKVKRDDNIGLMGAMIHENEARRNDEPLARLAKLKRYMARGAAITDAALRFKCSVQALQSLLDYDDNAISATKQAVESGKISQTTGAMLARIEPEEQKKAVNEVLSRATNGHTSQRVAKIVAAKTGAVKAVGIPDKRTQRAVLDHIQTMAHGKNASNAELAFYEGAEEAFKLILGDDEVDERLTRKRDEVYSLMKVAKSAAKKRGRSRLAERPAAV